MPTAEIVLLKLGGSLITTKDGNRALSADCLDAASRVIADQRRQSTQPLIVGHGSGSFGHRAALDVSWDNTSTESSPERTVAAQHIRDAAFDLHRQVIDSFQTAGVPTRSCPGHKLIGGDPLAVHRTQLQQAFENGRVLLTCGDVIETRPETFHIASTEVIFLALARHLREAGHSMRAIWAGRTRGILDARGQTIPLLKSEDDLSVATQSEDPDVTGGMRHRLETAFELAQLGVPSAILDGRDTASLKLALAAPDAKAPGMTHISPYSS